LLGGKIGWLGVVAETSLLLLLKIGTIKKQKWQTKLED